MRTRVGLLPWSLVFLGASAGATGGALAGDVPCPPLLALFEQQRSDAEDIIYFRNQDVLRGQVVNASVTIVTQYGMIEIPIERCAGLSFEGARSNTEAVVTVNYNRFSGMITDRIIRFRIGSSGAEIPVRKEKIRHVLLQHRPDETAFLEGHKQSDLFVMANGDLLTGEAAEREIQIRTDYGTIPVAFAEMKGVQMQGGENVTAIVEKANGDVMRGTLESEEITLDLDQGIRVEAIYKDKFAAIFVDQASARAPAEFGVVQPVLGESDGAAFAGTSGPGLTNSLGMEFVRIEPGEFWMGSPEAEDGRYENEGPRHRVQITKPFLLGKTEVTQGEWRAVMGTAPWSGESNVVEGDDYPAMCASWEDANEFCGRLGEKEGVTYRLPTEAEWEYACRAGTETRFSFGDDEGQLGQYAWYGRDIFGHAEPVGRKKPNPWGLFDMHGNVWEWCADVYDKRYDERSPAADPVNTAGGGLRSLRGGAWPLNPRDCRSAFRVRFDPVNRNVFSGFRVARTL